jgi:hypothetical protein
MLLGLFSVAAAQLYDSFQVLQRFQLTMAACVQFLQ